MFPKPFVSQVAAAGPYLAIIRYLMQRPTLVAEFTALGPKHPSREAQALALLVGFLRYNAASIASAEQLVDALQTTEFAALYRRTYRLICDLGDTGEDEAAFRDAMSLYVKFESKFAESDDLAANPEAPSRNLSVNTDEFLASYEWKRVRMQVLKRDGAKCRCCGATPATGAVMNVDHIKPRRDFPEMALDPNNLQVLCGDCNHGKGNWDTTDWRAGEKK
jgi:hypothetical protein